MKKLKNFVKGFFNWYEKRVGYMVCYPPTGMIPLQNQEIRKRVKEEEKQD